jgi:hypothetical protein
MGGGLRSCRACSLSTTIETRGGGEGGGIAVIAVERAVAVAIEATVAVAVVPPPRGGGGLRRRRRPTTLNNQPKHFECAEEYDQGLLSVSRKSVQLADTFDSSMHIHM